MLETLFYAVNNFTKCDGNILPYFEQELFISTSIKNGRFENKLIRNMIQSWIHCDKREVTRQKEREGAREDGGLAREKSDSGNTDGTEFHSDRVWIRLDLEHDQQFQQAYLFEA